MELTIETTSFKKTLQTLSAFGILLNEKHKNYKGFHDHFSLWNSFGSWQKGGQIVLVSG